MVDEALDTILICAVNTADEEYLRLDLEVREIANGLRHSRKHFRIEQQWAVRPSELRRALLDHKPAFVHFCGHGTGPEGLVMEGQLIDAPALAELFRIFSATIKCVVLNACFSVIQAEAIAKHVEYVIGMKKEIGDTAAIEFSTAFYDAIGAGESVEFAFDLACNAIQFASLSEHLTPRLFSRSVQQNVAKESLSHPITQDYPPTPPPSPDPETVDHLATMKWPDFERFATSALRDYYRGGRLEMIPRRLHGDGAQGTEATYIFDSPQTAVFKLWVEVKQTGNDDGVEPSTIGRHLVRATNEEVQKLVFVTNADYTLAMRREIERFAHRVVLDYALISGGQLLEIARGQKAMPPGKNGERVVLRKSSGKTLRSAAAPQRVAASLNVRCTVSPDRFLPAGENLHFAVPCGAPFYLLVDVMVVSAPAPVAVRISVRARESSWTVFPYGGAVDDSIGGEGPVGTGDCRRRAFVVFASHGPVSSDSFDVEVTTDAPAGSLRISTEAAGEADVVSRIVSDWIAPSRRLVLDALRDEITAWFHNTSFEARLLIADAGTGKSHSVAQLRQHWIALGAREFALDGGKSQSDLEFAQRLFQEVFPLDPPALGDDQTEVVAEWLTRAGMLPARARQIAHGVCHARRLDDNAQSLSEIMVSLLRRAARDHGLVLLVEDLHQCAPSALILLRETLRQLRGSSAHVLVVATSRPHAVTAVAEQRQQWSAYLTELASEFRSTLFKSPTEDEAVELLVRTLPTLEEHHAKQIVAQAGRTPLGAREAVQFLYSSGIAAWDAALGALRIESPERLLASMDLEEFRDVTALRVERFLETRPNWLHLFVVAAACVGRFFPVQSCLAAAAHADGVEVRGHFQDLRNAEILQPSPYSPAEWAFDHDVVRSAVLERDGALQQYAADALLGVFAAESDAQLLGSLAYQAGRGELAVELLTRAGNDAASRSRHADAAKSLRVVLAILRPREFTPAENLVNADEAIRRATLPSLTWSRTRVQEASLEVMRQMIRSSAEMGEAASETVARVLSLAMTLATTLSDSQSLAELEQWWGVHEFDVGNLERSLECHRKAATLYEQLPTAEMAFERTQNLVRTAIVLRQLGQGSASDAMLHHAERTRARTDLSSFVRIAQNAGALHFYGDLRRVRHYWTKALRAARLSRSPERIAHCLIDVGLIDVIEGRYGSARALLREARRLAEEFSLDNSHIRIMMHDAIIDMTDARFENARDQLLEAERLSEITANSRRLWRVRANLGTAYELLGNAAKSYANDSSAVSALRHLQGISAATSAKAERLNREVLAYANVVLRAETSSLHRTLRDSLTAREHDLARAALDAAEHGTTNRDRLLRLHLKPLGDVQRFVLTE